VPSYTIRTPFPPGGTQPHPRRRRLVDVPFIGPALAYLVSPWSQLAEVRATQLQHDDRISTLERDFLIMTGSVNDSINDGFDKLDERAAQIAGLLQAEFASLRAQLEAEHADDAEQVDAAVKTARAADLERVGKLLDVFAQLLPGETPQVETPAPGEPAELPAEVTPGDQGAVTTDDVIADPEVLAPAEPATEAEPLPSSADLTDQQ
jgi:hypothetical protein